MKLRRLHRPRRGLPRLGKGREASQLALVIGDEGGCLLHMRGHDVTARYFSPSSTASEMHSLHDLAARLADVPLRIYVDTLDQAYTHQTLPPVSSVSVRKLMERRRLKEFSDAYISTALLQGRNTDARRDWRFLLAGLECTPLVKAWLEVALEWPNPCQGIYLLPLEMARFAPQLMPKGEWRLMVSHHKTSGLRQVATRGDKLILTRLGQLPTDSAPEVIGGMIEQEVAGTQEYLRRLGGAEIDHLHVCIIASAEILKTIDRQRIHGAEMQGFTPSQAAQALNVSSAAQPSDRFADLVFTAAALTRKPLARLATARLNRQTLWRRLKRSARLGGRLGAIVLVGMTVMSIWNGIQAIQATAESEKEYTRRAALFASLQEKVKTGPGDIEQIIAIIELEQALNERGLTPQPLFARIAEKLSSDVRATSLSWRAQDANAANPSVEIKLTLEFDAVTSRNRDALRSRSVDTLNTLKAHLPGYDISYTSLPDSISDSAQVEMRLSGDDTRPPGATEAAQAQMTIRGPAMLPPVEKEAP